MIEAIKTKLARVRENSIIKAVERFLSGRFFSIVLAAFILLVQMQGWDIFGFSVLATLFIYVCIFGKSTTPLVPIVCLAVFCVSLQNSPWAPASGFEILENGSYKIGEAATLYTSKAFFNFVIGLGSVVVLSAIFRVVAYGDFKRLGKKNFIFWGIVVLCGSFLTSGWFSSSLEWEDFFSALLQIATFLIIYLFFATTLDFDTFTLDYIANVMVGGLICVIGAEAIVYVRRIEIFTDLNSVWKAVAVAGFGTSNSIGAYIAFCLPVCFYKMYRVRKSQKWIWSVILLIGIIAIFFSLCRAAMLALVVIVPPGIIAGLVSKRTRLHTLITMLVYILLIAAGVYVMYKTDAYRVVFDYFLEKLEGGTLNGLTSGRVTIWKRQWGYFLRDPIFGGGFVVDKESWVQTDFVNPNSGMSMFSVIAHSILFQALGGSGAVGVIAMGVHLFTVCKLLMKRRVQTCTFLTLAILSHWTISMLDTVFYTTQFTFLYLMIILALQADIDRLDRRQERKAAAVKKKHGKGYKPCVMFPFVEAGLGHIMPMKSIADAFDKKYGNVCRVVRSNFYTETKEKPLMQFEKNLTHEARQYAKHSAYGYLNMLAMNLFTPWILPRIIMDVYIPGCGRAARRHMKAINPDMVVSTHWSTPYYAHKLDTKPINVCYAPDARMIPFWRYPNDAVLISKEPGYKEALKKYKRRFNENNLFLVPFAIRGEALTMTKDKKTYRKELGLVEDKYTVTVMEGGYGEGKMRELVKKLVEADLPLNVVAICGNNDALRKELSALQPKEKLTLKVEGLCGALEYFAASDIFVGKSGASTIAEATYFGCAAIVSKFATTLERDNAAYYIHHVGNALKIFETDAIVEKLRTWCEDPTELHALQEKAKDEHDNYGSEKTADLLFDMLCERFPHLKQEE